MLAKRINDYAVLARVNVPWLDEAINWYVDTFDLQNDERFYVEGVWAQLYCPGINGFAIGLSQGTPTPGAGSVTTFVVDSIEDACEDLKVKGVVVGPIINEGKGVKLAFFYDPFGNNLAIRENSPRQPKPSQIGHQG
jgi:predicted enzyme related to lactoylglutathione lyase